MDNSSDLSFFILLGLVLGLIIVYLIIQNAVKAAIKSTVIKHQQYQSRILKEIALSNNVSQSRLDEIEAEIFN